MSNANDSSSTPLLLVGNPTSHSGKAAKRIDVARGLLADRGILHDFRPTLPDGGTVGMVAEAIEKEGFRTIVYMGGDGTFYEVATAISTSPHHSDIRMGMLPSGTANDQGKSFGISSAESALPDNIEIVISGKTEPIDVGKITALNDSGEPISTDYFFDSLGWGLSAAILATRNRELARVKAVPLIREIYRDQAVYVRAGIHEFGLQWVTRDRFSAEIDVDGQTHHLDHLSDLIISNTLVYAGDWIVSPDSSPSDGMVEVAPFRGLRDWMSKLIISHKKNTLSEEKVNKIGLTHSRNLQGKVIKIHILRPTVDKRLPAQRDGEEFVAADNYIIEVLPRHLPVIVPNNFHWI